MQHISENYLSDKLTFMDESKEPCPKKATWGYYMPKHLLNIQEYGLGGYQSEFSNMSQCHQG